MKKIIIWILSLFMLIFSVNAFSFSHSLNISSWSNDVGTQFYYNKWCIANNSQNLAYNYTETVRVSGDTTTYIRIYVNYTATSLGTLLSDQAFGTFTKVNIPSGNCYIIGYWGNTASKTSKVGTTSFPKIIGNGITLVGDGVSNNANTGTIDGTYDTYDFSWNSITWEVPVISEDVVIPSITSKWNFVNGTNVNYSNPSISFQINNSVLNTYDIGNQSIFLNGVLNISLKNSNVSQWNITINLSSITSQFNVSYNVTLPNASYKLNGVFFYADTIPLDINCYFIKNGVYNGVNNTNFSFGDTQIFKCSQYDINNYEFNNTEFDISNNIISSFRITNLTGTTNYSYTKTQTLSSLGNFSFVIQGWDSHTLNNPKPITTNIIGNSIIIDNDIKFSGDIKYINNKGQTVTYFYLSGDRYKFKATFNNQALTHTLNITTNERLEYIQDNYKGHFVYMSLRKWIDFQGNNVKNVIVTRIASNKFNIVVEHYTITDEIEFESIGDLNYVTKTYYYTVKTASTSSGLTEEEHNLFMLFGNNINTYLPYLALLYGVFKMLGQIIINIMFIFISVWFAKNVSKYAILIIISPILNFGVIMYNLLDMNLINSGMLGVFQFLSVSLFIIGCIILGIMYLIIPKEILRPNDSIYYKIPYNK